jgi:hypothetical protein
MSNQYRANILNSELQGDDLSLKQGCPNDIGHINSGPQGADIYGKLKEDVDQ